MWKRKRDAAEDIRWESQERREEEHIVQRSKKPARPPSGENEAGGEGEEGTVAGELLQEGEVGSLGKPGGMESCLRRVIRELEEIKRREEEWRVERGRMEKRIEDLERKWEKEVMAKSGGRGIEVVEKRVMWRREQKRR